jgi:hypothetical protein
MTTTCERLINTTALLRTAALDLAVADQAVHHAERDLTIALRMADRDLATVLSGLGLRRWENLMDNTATIATSADGLDLVLAHRHADEIRAALFCRTEVENEHGSKVALAKARRSAARRALKHLVGPDLSAELCSAGGRDPWLLRDRGHQSEGHRNGGK